MPVHRWDRLLDDARAGLDGEGDRGRDRRRARHARPAPAAHGRARRPARQRGTDDGPDALPGYERLNEEGGGRTGAVAARIALTLGLDRPGRLVGRITSPTLVIVCEPDTVAPDATTLRHLRRAANPAVEVQQVPYGHFDIYYDAPFEELVAAQVRFLQVHLGLTTPASRTQEEVTS